MISCWPNEDQSHLSIQLWLLSYLLLYQKYIRTSLSLFKRQSIPLDNKGFRNIKNAHRKFNYVLIIIYFLKIGEWTNMLERFWHKSSLIPYTLIDLWGHTSFHKKLCLQNIDILEKILKDWALNKKCIAEKGDWNFMMNLYDS